MRTIQAVLVAVACLMLSAVAHAAMKPVAHPFILWTKEDVAAIKARIDTEPWAKAQIAALKDGKYGNSTFVNLFKYQVLGDRRAGEAERDYLLHLSGRGIPQLQKEVLLDQDWRHLDNSLDALRYDVLYDLLTPEQRKGIEDTFRSHIDYVLAHPYVNNRLSFLPNMQMPYMLSVDTMAVALQDEQRIRDLWAAPSGYTWFFNEYLSDGGLYNEEFAKMTSLIGEFLICARGLDRLGMSELGFDYRGKSGATLERYVESLLWMGYPRTEIPGGTPAYTRVSMGDTRGGSLLQHTNVLPFWRDGSGGPELWSGANMNGRDHRNSKTTKLHFPQWCEILAARYPNGPFAYFLAQMRGPGEEAYLPTPFWGLSPVDPKKVTPPAAPSQVFPERGFAMLRANEGPGYWESTDPAVALQFATLYVHYTADCFSLLGYYAYNRPIYVNRSISAGYNGGSWDFSVRGHCGVVVDNLQAQPIGQVPTRQEFTDQVKFVSARGVMQYPDRPYKGRGEVRSSDQPKTPATEIYPGVDLSRSLFLTKEYLFDVYQLRSQTPRRYDWLVHAPGRATPDDGAAWAPSHDLQASLMNAPVTITDPQTKQQVAVQHIPSTGERKLEMGDKAWRLRTTQTTIAPDPAKTAFGKEWYDRAVGVRVWMLGEAGTAAYTFDTPTNYAPGTPRAPGSPQPVPEFEGVSLDVTRTAASTAFVALHEPFEHATPRIESFTRIAQTDDAVAALVASADFSDRLLLRWGDKAAEPITLTGQGESFTFADHAYLRISADTVNVTGDLRAMSLKVTGTPKLVVNGKEVTAAVVDGTMTYVK